MADPKFIARQVTITAPVVGTWSVTHPELVARGITPKAVIVMASAVDSEANEDISANASGSWGVYDGTDQSVQNWYARDAQTTSENNSGFKSSKVARVGGLGGGTTHLEMNATGFTSGGCDFNVTTSNVGQVVRVTVLFFGGTELAASYFTAKANASTVTVTPGFETDLIFASGRDGVGATSETDIDYDDYDWSLIIARNNGAGDFDDVGCHNVAKDAQSTTNNRSIISNDRAKWNLDLAPTVSLGSITLENVTSTQFDVRQYGVAEDLAIFGLAMDLGTVTHGIQFQDYAPKVLPPDNIINHPDLGFRPELVYSPKTYRNVIVPIAGVDSAGGMGGGVNIYAGGENSGHSYSDKFNVATSVDKTMVEDGFFWSGLYHDGRSFWEGVLIPDDLGFDILWNSNSTVSYRWQYLAVEDQGAWVGSSGCTAPGACGTPSVQPGAVNLTATGCAAPGACGTPSVSVGAVDLAPSGCVAPGACGTPSVLVGSVALQATGCPAPGACGTPTLQPQAVNLTATGCSRPGACGTPSVSVGAVALAAVACVALAACGTPSVTTGSVELFPTGCISSPACGTPTAAVGAVNLSASGCAAPGACGTPSLAVGGVSLTAVGCTASGSCGTPLVVSGADVAPQGCTAPGACGTASIQPGALSLTAVGCTASGACGTPSVAAGPLTLTSVGCTAQGACGTPTVALTGVTLVVNGCTAPGACGTPTVSQGAAQILAVGCTASGACGSTTVTTDAQVITANSCSSVSKCGIVFLQGGVIPETMHTRIKNALICAARLGTFIKVDQQCSGVGDCGDVPSQSQGLQVAPATILVNEVRTKFGERDHCSPCSKNGRRRTQWMWKMILRFDCDVTSTLFDEQLACTPVVLPRLPEPVEGLHTKNRQVVLQLLDIVPKHPPGGNSSSGAEFHYIFEAQTSA